MANTGVVVIYHNDCDGFGAAWAIRKHFLTIGNNYANAEYIAVDYNDAVPKIMNSSRLFILDFSYSAKLLQVFCNRMTQVVIIDHHKTSKEAVESIRKIASIVHDTNKSGAVLTWEYFHKEPPPLLLQYVQDRDLWKFELAGTKEVHAALLSYPRNFDTWDMLNLRINSVIEEGTHILRHIKVTVKYLCGKAELGKLPDGIEVPCLNTSLYTSECGNQLLENFPNYQFAFTYYTEKGKKIWELRSRGNVDVGEIAKKFGGGGHKNAAGFVTQA